MCVCASRDVCNCGCGQLWPLGAMQDGMEVSGVMCNIIVMLRAWCRELVAWMGVRARHALTSSLSETSMHMEKKRPA